MAKKKVTFEEAISRLEEIVNKLESEEVQLEHAVKLYQEGIALSSICKEKLTQAQSTVVLLQKQSGIWQETPFEEE